MGVHANIKHNQFPAQGSLLNKEVSLCFHYDTSERLKATCVREDLESPGVTIFKTEDNKYVLATECHYSFVTQESKDGSR